MTSGRQKHVAVCGAGPVGALCACYLAKRGYRVDVYEMRPDIRTLDVVRGRSINLAISCRGREALKMIGLEEQITSKGIPMFARMIHALDGTRRPIQYGTKNQCIMSIDRRLLNEALLTEAETYDNIQIYFSHKLLTCDFDLGEAVFENDLGSKVRIKVDLIIGADGAFSAVRKQMMKMSRFDYQQQYIPHGYMELNIPDTDKHEFAMEVNYLHIWPRHEYMLIALPNQDKSYTTTLFMPFEMFQSITTGDMLLQLFRREFPDALPLLGEQGLVTTYFSSQPQAMVSVKCHPYHVKDKVVILGDAAHAVVPFYGQGMNCVWPIDPEFVQISMPPLLTDLPQGLEDCIVLNELLDKHNDDLGQALQEYTRVRHPDAIAISDLAMYNYIEMRSRVNSKLFLLRKKLDNFLHWLFPQTWVPLYTMVSFTRIRYHECVLRKEWQDKVLVRTLRLFAYVGGALAVTSLYTYMNPGCRWRGAVETVVTRVQQWGGGFKLAWS